jgi:TolB-like protein
MLFKWMKYFLILLSCLLLTSCTSLSINHSRPIYLPCYDKIAIFPFTNMTETPQADERAAVIVASLIRNKGGMRVVSYPRREGNPSLIPGVRKPIEQSRLLAWARQQHARYAINGSVTEWNYKVGLDGEPAIGLTLEVIDVNSGHVIWSAVGSKSGGSRTALSDVAIELTERMLWTVRFYR